MPESSLRHRAAKTWHKIIIETDSRMTEAVTAYLADLADGGAEISSSKDVQPDDQKQHADFEKITAYIPIGSSDFSDKAASEKVQELRKFLAGLPGIFSSCPAPRLHIETITEEDWGQLWKSFFSSFQITPKLRIRPSWEETVAQASDPMTEQFEIEMDPGLAFGTGHHASTQLALLLLEELFQQGKNKLVHVLDVGTGSGILAMACGLFGATDVLALDNDPDAVATARKNISSNGLEHIVTVSAQDVGTLAPGFNLIVANIVHDTLVDMAKVLSSLMAPGGWLVLSGILKGEQERSIRGKYAEQGVKFIKSLTKDEWAALQFQKG